MDKNVEGPRLNPNLLTVPLYIAGKSIEEVQEEFGLDEVIKLASNESSVGPSPLAVEAARRALLNAHRYPGISDRKLRQKLSQYLDADVLEENVIIGNGGTDLLRMITQAFVFDGGNTVMSRATFPMYKILTTAYGGTPRIVDSRADYAHDLPVMSSQVDRETRIVFLCSPNNPSGHVISHDELEAFLAMMPGHVVVVIDESYREFVTDPRCADSLALFNQGHNLIIVRSFSKTAGLANLRVGFAVGSSKLIEYLRHAQLPFHTGGIALAAAAASLDDCEYQDRNYKAVVDGREYLHAELHRMGLNALPSQANFVTIADPPIQPGVIVDSLMRRGLVVRAMTAFGMPNAVRVTVGSRPENEQFLEALRAVLGEAQH